VIQFFCAFRPPTVTAQEHQVTVVRGKPRFYDPPAVKDARTLLLAHVGPHAPAEPLDGPVRLITKWLFPLTGKHYDGEWRETKPDTDNLQKLLKDVMSKAGFWQNDARVASETAEKFWASRPGLFIRLEPLMQPPRPPRS